jgi:hypothetical protein
MPLYHACQQLHLNGQILTIPDGLSAHAYTKSVSRGRQWLEDAFEQARAGRSIPRRLAIYACDRPEFAARFALAEGGTMPNVYEVDKAAAFSPFVRDVVVGSTTTAGRLKSRELKATARVTGELCRY